MRRGSLSRRRQVCRKWVALDLSVRARQNVLGVGEARLQNEAASGGCRAS